MKTHPFSQIIISVLALLAVTLQLNAQNDADYRHSAAFKLLRAESAITSLYVDTVDEGKLVEDAIRGMLEKLDPHSSYSTAKEVKQMMASLQGNFDGVGIQYNIVDDTIMVIQPTVKGPSERAGVLPGDRIVRINDTIVAGVKITTDQVISKLRGKRGTEVSMTVRRDGLKDSIVFRVVRERIPVHSITAVFMARPGVGYIRIDNFSATTGREFSEALEKLRKQGMTSLILDLQSNGGGYLSAAVEVANEFLEQGDLIVYTEGRATRSDVYKADGRGSFLKGKVVVLVDDYSASAAEIVSGAIQDQDRGVIVGRRTFGKGLVQRPVDLPDGSMMRITTSHYYTPSGRCIQKPYEKGKKKDYSNDIEQRLKKGELTNADSIHFADSLKFKTLKTGRTVYGGGGIMPDIFVALDTTYNTQCYRKLSAQGCVAPTIVKYTMARREKYLQAYPTIEKFKASFVVPEDLISDIMAQGKKKNVTPKDDDEREKTLVSLRRVAKALMARDLWDMSEYFQIFIEHDHIAQRGLEEMKGNK